MIARMAKKTASVHLRLLPEVAEGFRDHVRRQGDVAALILAAILETDLENIPLAEVRLKFGKGKADHTFFDIPRSLLARLRGVAAARKCSVNALLNAAIAKYTRALKLTSPRGAIHKRDGDHNS